MMIVSDIQKQTLAIVFSKFEMFARHSEEKEQ
jgi:hypothetical protein